MIIAIKNVTSLYARAQLANMACPTVEIRSSKLNETPKHDWIISAPEEFDVYYLNENTSSCMVEIYVKYHGVISKAVLNKTDFEYIVTYKGDLFVEKEK